MKGYKIFNNNWTCKGFQYEVGKEYEFKGKIDICESGFHFCQKIEDCFKYYPSVQWNKIAEVEATGKTLTHKEDSKICTDKIKILREIKWFEFDGVSVYGRGINNGRGINDGHGINNGRGISDGHGINYGRGISDGAGISDGYGISDGSGINYGYGINDGHGINYGRGINDGSGINYGRGISDGRGINDGSGINYGRGINDGRGINYGRGINNGCGISDGYGINDAWGCLSCEGISRSIFCFKQEGVRLHVFNKPVSAERFNRIKQTLDNFNWYPEFNNLKSLYLKNGSKWEETPIPNAKGISKEEAWADMPDEMRKYILAMPEFDADIFFEITGIKFKKEMENGKDS